MSDLEDWYLKFYGPDSKPEQAIYVDSNGIARDVDLSKLSAMQKLQLANRGSIKSPPAEPQLTDQERGMSPAEFAKLPPLKRLQIANDAIFKRKLT